MMKILPVIPTDTTIVADPIAITIDPNSFGIAATPTVYNVATAANVEASFALPAKTKAFELKTRSNGSLQLAFASGQSNANFLLVPPGGSYSKDGLSATGLMLYFQTKASDTVQITAWV